jgi:hypothetical protein
MTYYDEPDPSGLENGILAIRQSEEQASPIGDLTGYAALMIRRPWQPEMGPT